MIECQNRAGALNPDLGERQRWLSEEGTSEIRQEKEIEKISD